MSKSFQLSYSSANLLRGCSTRFYHYKSGTAKDPDHEEDNTAFIVGKSFHQILEDTLHSKPEKMGAALEKCVELHKLPEEQVPIVHAMVLKYLRLHNKVGLECVHCEYEINTDKFIGFVDAILKDDLGNWWICDLKTAGRIYGDLNSRLANDMQLNLYSYFAPQIAEDLGLDFDKFMGCRYRVTTKSIAKQKASESYIDFVQRLIKLVRSYDYIIPKDKMNPSEFMADHMALQDTAEKLLNRELEPAKNFSSCFSYFRPCEWYSQCHGKTFTECGEDQDVISEI